MIVSEGMIPNTLLLEIASNASPKNGRQGLAQSSADPGVPVLNSQRTQNIKRTQLLAVVEDTGALNASSDTLLFSTPWLQASSYADVSAALPKSVSCPPSSSDANSLRKEGESPENCLTPRESAHAGYNYTRAAADQPGTLP